MDIYTLQLTWKKKPESWANVAVIAYDKSVIKPIGAALDEYMSSFFEEPGFIAKPNPELIFSMEPPEMWVKGINLWTTWFLNGRFHEPHHFVACIETYDIITDPEHSFYGHVVEAHNLITGRILLGLEKAADVILTGDLGDIGGRFMLANNLPDETRDWALDTL